MLYFRSPAVENDLPPVLDLRPGSLAGLGPVAMPEFATSGLAAASVVETARGPVLARDIRVGDRLITRDSGVQTVRWVGCSTVMYGDGGQDPGPDQKHKGPVRIRAGALGTSPQAGNLVLAPGHRVLVQHPLNELLFAVDEAMACVGDLTHVDGIDFVPRSVGRWTHFLLDRHQMVRANGLWVETLSPDMWSIRVAYPDEWHAITEALPRLRYEVSAADYVEARITLDHRELRLLDTL